jgi:hypothetical protein
MISSSTTIKVVPGQKASQTDRQQRVRGQVPPDLADHEVNPPSSRNAELLEAQCKKVSFGYCKPAVKLMECR